jgi:hypothetical protein
MFSWFLNPGFLVAGGAMVSSPIIIHLLNRMRYKRIRWAAMEFLLKSQKKNRRRLIIEQLILLLLRCLLVVLALVLVARMVKFFAWSIGDTEQKKTVHVIVLDDSLSMTDWVPQSAWPTGNQTPDKNCFNLGKHVIYEEIAGKVGKSTAPQDLVLVVLSRLKLDPKYEPSEYHAITEDRRDILKNDLDKLKCTALHLPLVDGIKKARAIADAHKDDHVVVHVVSDFRQRDWAVGDAKALHGALVDLVTKGGPGETKGDAKVDVKVNLIDCAHPYRTTKKDAPQRHENVGIVEFYPETRVVASGAYVRFWLTLQNFGSTEKQVQIELFDPDSGQQLHEFGADQMVKVPPGPPVIVKVDPRWYRDTDCFVQLSARLGFPGGAQSEDGLTADNIRHAAIKVRKQVPILIVDSAGERQRDQDGADTRHVAAALDAAPGAGFAITKGGVDELEKANLEKYLTIYLLNIPRLSPNQQKNLENYLANGGSAAFFLGKEVDPQFYNENLFKQGKGVFPVELADQFLPPKDKKELEPNLDDDHYKVLLRSENFPNTSKFPIFGPVFDNKRMLESFTYLPIRRFFPVKDLQNWKEKAVPGVLELATMPNLDTVNVYAARAQEIRRRLGELPGIEHPYTAALTKYSKMINKALERDRKGNQKQCYELAAVLDQLLHDQRGASTDDLNKADMIKFWEDSKHKHEREELARDIAGLLKTVRYGHPLVLASRYGKDGRGRVVTVLTTAGKDWNGWLSLPSYVPMILEMQSYLTSLGKESNLSVGDTFPLPLGKSYLPTVKRTYFLSHLEKTKDRREAPPAKGKEGQPKIEVQGKTDADKEVKEEQAQADGDGNLTYMVRDALRPGFYRFDVTPKTGTGAKDKPPAEERGYVFNVDCLREGDLQRISRDLLQDNLKAAPKDSITLYGPEGWSESLVDEQRDFSQSPWLYLIFLVVLVAEQALAVHLSFHLRDADTTLPVQALKSQALA